MKLPPLRIALGCGIVVLMPFVVSVLVCHWPMGPRPIFHRKFQDDLIPGPAYWRPTPQKHDDYGNIMVSDAINNIIVMIVTGDQTKALSDNVRDITVKIIDASPDSANLEVRNEEDIWKVEIPNVPNSVFVVQNGAVGPARFGIARNAAVLVFFECCEPGKPRQLPEIIETQMNAEEARMFRKLFNSWKDEEK
jgi:hypothetical protein